MLFVLNEFGSPDTLLLGGGFKYFFYFHPDPWGNDPI